jgi:hypothetical protein
VEPSLPVMPAPTHYAPCPSDVINWAPMPAPPVKFTNLMMPANPPMMAVIPAMPKMYTIHRTSHIRVVHESGKAKLQMQKDGVSSTAVRLKYHTDEAGSLRFAAGEKHIHLSGKMWKATADHVELYDDGRVILIGHVKVISDKVGVCASLKADRVALRVKHGKVEKISGGVFSAH